VRANEFFARRSRIAAALAERNLDALIVSGAPNVRYLTGFTGSNGLALLSPAGTVLFTDPRYEIQAAQETACRIRIARGSLYRAVMQAAARRRFRRLGFEKGRLPYQDYEELQAGLTLGASLVPLAGVVEAQRMVKSRAEIALIQRSVETNSAAFDRAIRRARPGVRECELAAELDYQMRLLGAQGPAFDTIVAAGPRSALPHAQPTVNTLRRNQLLLIDVGASREGYASDMSRMAFLGRPGLKVRRMYRAVLEAQLAAIAAVRPGIRAEQIDHAARRVLRAGKLEKAFVHAAGHGLGLEIHEAPRLGKGEKTPLAEGMVITIEPGIYLEGFGGIRIEDTVVVTQSGSSVLTPTSKDLLIL
jgi:Xaa-Pro aminopeptidase